MSEKLGRAPKVLVVSNQQTTGPLWVFSLQQQQLNVLLEADPTRTLQRSEIETPDLIILDIHFPETETLELIRSLRSEMLTPILLLTPVRSEEYVIETYKAGVDDCMIKPVSPSLFQAKVRVLLRRFGSFAADEMRPLKVGTLQLFPTERMVMLRNGGVIQLTNLELRLLYYLMNRPGQIVSTEELNQRVWGYTAEADNTMLKNVVYRLRRKIEADPSNPIIVQTVVGVGYKLAAE
ncbi:MAG TPA: response regulator transcription factor [Anaerolineales bacterium]|nr:response regulator transcription factor [Anaerolineales bacterium]